MALIIVILHQFFRMCVRQIYHEASYTTTSNFDLLHYCSCYRVSVPVDERCEIVIGGERKEATKEFKVLRNSVE